MATNEETITLNWNNENFHFPFDCSLNLSGLRLPSCPSEHFVARWPCKRFCRRIPAASAAPILMTGNNYAMSPEGEGLPMERDMKMDMDDMKGWSASGAKDRPRMTRSGTSTSTSQKCRRSSLPSFRRFAVIIR